MSHLKQIGYALQMYAEEQGGAFPASLWFLAPRYVQDPVLFECPEAKEHLAAGARHYDYIPGLDPSAHPDLVVAFDEEANHHGDGRNVLCVDGHVEWMKEEAFQERVAKTTAWLAKRRAREQTTP
jgi:prepilin-type processing-associated H-X9-DG protein